MSPPVLPGLFGAIAPVLDHYGYLAVAFFVTVEDFGIPVPGETALIAAALYAGAGRMNIVAVGIIGFFAAVVGDNIGFTIGHFGGRALAVRFGKYVFLTSERLDKAEAFFERHGGKIIVVARFIEGLRQANGIVAGITGMHWRRFLFFNAIGAALWVGVWVSLGYLAGNHIIVIYQQITRYSLYVLIALGVALAAFIAWHLRRRARRRAGQAAASGAAGESGTAPQSGAAREPGAAPDPGAAAHDDRKAAGPDADAPDAAPGPDAPDAIREDRGTRMPAGEDHDGAADNGRAAPGPYPPHPRDGRGNQQALPAYDPLPSRNGRADARPDSAPETPGTAQERDQPPDTPDRS
ncbi:MAG TPA: DedA family protein [Streptosporangiaceae bacterium]|nr:DedA family protein [Streptosporangiaceae bacterium]